MQFRNIVITGGAGFIGSNLALYFRTDFENVRIFALDNLKRRGSELNLTRLKDHGVEFFHGDIRCPEDLAVLPDFDLLVDCSAEPSIQAGVDGSPLEVVHHNLIGTIHLMEAVRQKAAALLFLSTSRVYPISTINQLSFDELETRYQWRFVEEIPGFSAAGIDESFPLADARSLYGTTKLAAEMLLQEYTYKYDMPVLINRCGLIAGPWQMGKVDQGVVALWVARHFFKKPLSYIGYGGKGKQVRDMLHVRDLFRLIKRQLSQMDKWQANIYNVGGGNDLSVSLLELTDYCREATGNSISIHSVPGTSPVDIRIFITDSTKAQEEFNWQPDHNVSDIIGDIHRWIVSHRDRLHPVFG